MKRLRKPPANPSQCDECRCELVRTESGWVCPKGHGKILSDENMLDRGLGRFAIKRARRKRWLPSEELGRLMASKDQS